MVMKTARRVVIAILGGTVVLIGIVMIVFPGPAMIVIPAGLAILATEFVWARRLLKRVKSGAASVMASVRNATGMQAKPREAEVIEGRRSG